MSKEEQMKIAIAGDRLILVEFFATWCGHCHHMKPVVQAFKEEMKDLVDVMEVDVDENESLASFYDIKSMPTFVLFHKGEQRWRQSGEMTLKELIQGVKSVDI